MSTTWVGLLVLVLGTALSSPAAAAPVADAPLTADAEDDESDPWSEEAEQLLEDRAALDREERPDEPTSFADSPWVAPLMVAGATVFGSVLYAGAFVWGSALLFQQVPSTPGGVLFAGFFAAPLLPSLGAGLAAIVVTPWWRTALTVVGGLVGGALGVATGMAGLFLIGPLLPDPQTFIWFAGLGLPLVTASAFAIGTTALVPPLVDVLVDDLGVELPRAFQERPANE